MHYQVVVLRMKRGSLCLEFSSILCQECEQLLLKREQCHRVMSNVDSPQCLELLGVSCPESEKWLKGKHCCPVALEVV